jgi:hypothetical protein
MTKKALQGIVTLFGLNNPSSPLRDTTVKCGMVQKPRELD